MVPHQYYYPASDLQHSNSIDQRSQLQTAHKTAIRFKQPFANPGAFIERIIELKDTYIGNDVVTELELVANA